MIPINLILLIVYKCHDTCTHKASKQAAFETHALRPGLEICTLLIIVLLVLLLLPTDPGLAEGPTVDLTWGTLSNSCQIPHEKKIITANNQI